MDNKKENQIGIIYNFFPVRENDEGDIEACETWQWRFFGWWFELYTYLRSIIAIILGIENLQFEIKLKK